MVVTSPSHSKNGSESSYLKHMEEKKGYQSSYMKRIHERPSLSIQKSLSFSNKVEPMKQKDIDMKKENLRRNIIPNPVRYHSFQSVSSPRVLNSPSESVASTDTRNETYTGRGFVENSSISKLKDVVSPSNSARTTDSNTGGNQGYFKYISGKHISQDTEKRDKPETPTQRNHHTDTLSKINLSQSRNIPYNSPASKQISRSSINAIDTTHVLKNDGRREALGHRSNYHSREKRESNQTEHDVFWTRVSVKVSYALLRHGAPNKYAEIAQMTILELGSKQKDTSQESLNHVASATSGAILKAGGTGNIAAIAAVQCINGFEDVLTSEEQLKRDVSHYMTNMCSSTQDFVSLRVVEGKQVVQALSVELSEKLSDFRIYMKETTRRFRHHLKKQTSSMNRSTQSSRDSLSLDLQSSRSRRIPLSKSSSFSTSSCSSTSSSSESSFSLRRQRMHSYREHGSRRSFHDAPTDESYGKSNSYIQHGTRRSSHGAPTDDSYRRSRRDYNYPREGN